MNKVILMGRLTKDPETRYSQGPEPLAYSRYSIAVNRRSKREGEPDADFFNCVAFGKAAEFAERYFKKGLMVVIAGRLTNNKWVDQAGQNRISTEIIIEDQHFAESKNSFESRMATYGFQQSSPQQPQQSQNPYNGQGLGQNPEQSQPPPQSNTLDSPYENIDVGNKGANVENDGFYPIEETINEADLPF